MLVLSHLADLVVGGLVCDGGPGTEAGVGCPCERAAMHQGRLGLVVCPAQLPLCHAVRTWVRTRTGPNGQIHGCHFMGGLGQLRILPDYALFNLNR